MEKAIAIIDRMIGISERESIAAHCIADPMLALRYEMTICVMRLVRAELVREDLTETLERR